MIQSFRSKALQQFSETENAKKLPVQNHDRVRKILLALNAATKAKDMDIPGFQFHDLKGKDKGRSSVWVSGNYRITFGFEGENATHVDIEDYH